VRAHGRGYPARGTSAAAHPRACTVAIVGGTGSGKTTLANALAAALGDRCAVIDHDSYYRDLSHLLPADRAAVNFDHPDSLENDLLALHLERLRNGVPIDKPCYSFATHTRLPRTERIAPRPVVVVEGILLLAVSELQRSFDLRVFVDVDADVRALRRLRRDVSERGRTVDGVFAQWLETVRPMHLRFVAPARRQVDLVVSGEAPLADAVGAIVAALPARRTMPAFGADAARPEAEA